MALGLFRRWSTEDLQTLFENASATMLAGTNRVVAEVSAGDVTSRKEFMIDNKTFWEELNAELDSRDGSRVTRTSIRYV